MLTRPKSVVVVAAFLFFATVIAILVGSSLLFPNPLVNSMWRLNQRGAAAFHAMGNPAGYGLIGLGIATCAAGFGLLRGKRWAWWFAVVLFAVDGCGDVVSFFVTHEILRTVVGVGVSGIFVLMLVQSAVRRWFLEKGAEWNRGTTPP